MRLLNQEKDFAIEILSNLIYEEDMSDQVADHLTQLIVQFAVSKENQPDFDPNPFYELIESINDGRE